LALQVLDLSIGGGEIGCKLNNEKASKESIGRADIGRDNEISHPGE
jgi:hypothetical protein